MERAIKNKILDAGRKKTPMLYLEWAGADRLRRLTHRLDEWHLLCDWVKTLPYMAEILGAIG